MLAVALIVLLCWPAAASAQPPVRNPLPPEARLIEVGGTGEVCLAPTTGEATLSVEARAATAAAALGQVSAATARVLAALKPELAEGDRATTEGYDLFPIYESQEGRSRLTGYRALGQLRLEVTGPKRLGELLDIAIQKGATGLTGVRFSNPKLAEARRQAAAKALKEAHLLAERLAAEAGVRLGRLLRVSSGTPGGGPGPLRFRAAGLAAEAALPIEPGQLSVRATLTAVYEIGDRR